MNFFINQGRCRVCGKMFCCSNHQKEHERLEHKEYAYVLVKLPITCKKCSRSVHSVHDLHTKCHPFMDHRFMNGDFGNTAEFSSNKPNRKRTINEAKELTNDIQPITSAAHERKKLIPVYKFKRTEIKKVITTADIGQQTLVIEVNQIGLLIDSSKSSVFSPQLNVSYKMLMNNSVIKSSTPLNEDKDNSPAVPDKNCENNESIYKSPELSVYKTPQVFKSPMIVISAKKNTPPGIISNFSKRMSKKVFKNRRVTFELVKTTELEENFTIYGTPTTAMEIIEEISEQEEIDITIPGSPPSCLLFKIMKRMRNAINIIPRTISTAWDWSNQRFGTSKTNDNEEIRSPLKKRPKYDTAGVNLLVRKPITSHWVDMSVNSLFRKPLPNYVHRFSNTEENYP